MSFAFIDAEKARFPIVRMCDVLEVSQSGFLRGKGVQPVRGKRMIWFS